MKSIPYTPKQRSQIQSLNLKNIIAIRKHQKIKTQPSSFQTQLNIKELAHIDSSSDFPSIFVKRRRNQYSGYKQLNLSRCNIIRFKEQNHDTHRYHVSRKYQINLKNIAKLRKRYSLESTNFKGRSKDSSHLMGSTVIETKKDDCVQEITSERKLQKNLKGIIREIAKNQKSTSERGIFISEQQTQERLSHQHHQTYFQRYNSEIRRRNSAKQNPQSQQPCKISSFKTPEMIGKRLINSKMIKYGNKSQKKTEESAETCKQKIEETKLCGWSNQSFYPKAKAKFFQQFGEKMRLLNDPL